MRWTLHRRRLGTLFGGFLLSLLGRSRPAQANPACELTAYESAIAWESYYGIDVWIAGFGLSDSDLNHRVNVALLLKFPQTKNSFVEKVILTDNEKNIIEGRHFTASDKMSSGYPPYIVIHNINPQQSSRFFVYIQLREGDKTRKFRHVLGGESLKPSQLNGPQLPPVVAYDLQNDHQGVLSSPYRFSASVGRAKIRAHALRASFEEIHRDGSFRMKVYFMHQDQDPDHFMRYFIVADPVGRIIGLTKRQFGDGISGFVYVSNLTKTQQNQWGLTKDKVAKIIDCPYVQVFVDDKKEVLARTVVWLR